MGTSRVEIKLYEDDTYVNHLLFGDKWYVHIGVFWVTIDQTIQLFACPFGLLFWVEVMESFPGRPPALSLCLARLKQFPNPLPLTVNKCALSCSHLPAVILRPPQIAVAPSSYSEVHSVPEFEFL